MLEILLNDRCKLGGKFWDGYDIIIHGGAGWGYVELSFRF